MYGKSSITTVIRTQKLGLCPVQRLPKQRIIKQVLIGGITGRKPRGRPKTK